MKTFGSVSAAILQSSAGPFDHHLTTNISIEKFSPNEDNEKTKKEIKYVESKGLVIVKKSPKINNSMPKSNDPI